MRLFSKKTQTVSEVVKPIPKPSGRKKKAVEEQIVYYLPNETIPTPTGKVPEKVFSFMKDIGEPHIENYADNEIIARIPLIAAILKKYASHVIGNGFDVRTDEDALTEEVREYNKQIQMEKILRKAVIAKKVASL